MPGATGAPASSAPSQVATCDPAGSAPRTSRRTCRPCVSKISSAASPARASPNWKVVCAANGLGAFWARNEIAGASFTPTGSTPFTSSVSGDHAPQLPVLSCARTHSLRVPVKNCAVEIEAETFTVAVPNAPLSAPPGAPWLGSAVAPYTHCAAATAPPPVSASLTCADSVAALPRTIGLGARSIEPAITPGPCVSPPLRWIENAALLRSVAVSAGEPSSAIRTRTRAFALLGTVVRFHGKGLGPADELSTVHESPPSSEYSITRWPTERAGATLSVHVMLVLAAVRVSPPLGAVTSTVGRARPSSHTMVLSSTSLRIALGVSNGGSSALNSNDICTCREAVPPQNAVAGFPLGAEFSQRNPSLSGVLSLSRQV